MISGGHWFCDNCDDVVNIRGRGRPHDVERCPVCGQDAASFIPHKPSPGRRVRPDAAKAWFAEMRRAVNESTNE